MDVEWIRNTCNQLPGVTEDIKWEHDLCFSVGNKMFLVIGIDSTPVAASFKVKDEVFDALCARPGFKPAPYLAKNKWVLTEDIKFISKKEWEQFIRQSYELVKNKLSVKLRKQLGLE